MHPLTGLFLASMPFLLGGCGIPIAVAVASYGADGVLLLATDKTSGDHLVSMASGKDCAMWRVIKGREVCVDRQPGEGNPYNVDYDAPHREVGEGGMVTVYAASRQGGRLLTNEEAKVALVPKPTTTASQAPQTEASPVGAATADQPAVDVAGAVLPAESAPSVPRVRQQSPTSKSSAKTGRSAGKKGSAPGRKPGVVAERRATPKSAAKTASTRRGPATPRTAPTKTGQDRSRIDIAGR